MLERLEHSAQAIAGQFVGVADPWPQVRIGLYQLDEEAIQCGHRRAGIIAVMQWRQIRFDRLADRQWVIALQRTNAAIGKQGACLGQLARGHPQRCRIFVEQRSSVAILVRIGR
ncbi:hypothetical protein D9M68_694750 [compost metagenome]